MEGINVTKKEKAQVNKAQALLKKISPSLIGIAVIAAGVFIGMIDEIGSMPEAKSYLEGLINTKVEVCW